MHALALSAQERAGDNAEQIVRSQLINPTRHNWRGFQNLGDLNEFFINVMPGCQSEVNQIEITWEEMQVIFNKWIERRDDSP
jgi:hypothetical protein